MKTIKGLKKGQTIEVVTSDGKEKGVVMHLGEKLVVMKMLEPFTSGKAHGYHWSKGDLKSVTFRRMISLKKIDYSLANNKVAPSIEVLI